MRQKMTVFILTTIALLLGISAAFSATINLRPDSPGGIRLALMQAYDGDVIVLNGPGVFSGPNNDDLFIELNNVTIRGMYGAEVACVEGWFTYGTIQIANLQFVGGKPLAVEHGEMTITGTTFRDCTQAVAAYFSTLTAEKCEFVDSGGVDGHAVRGVASDLNLSYCSFDNGSVSSSDCHIDMAHCNINGAGIPMKITERVTNALSNVLFTGSSPGLEAKDASVSLDNITFGGAGLQVKRTRVDVNTSIFTGCPIAIKCDSDSNVDLQCNVFWGNTSNVGCQQSPNGSLLGMIRIDPMLCEDYNLQDGSPCLNYRGCGQIGARGANCPGKARLRSDDVATFDVSWGDIKRMMR